MKYSSNWDGIPNNVDSAVQYSDGRSYFFKRGQYYKFDDETISVEEGDPGYPRDAGVWWFGCSETKSPLIFPDLEKWKEEIKREVFMKVIFQNSPNLNLKCYCEFPREALK